MPRVDVEENWEFIKEKKNVDYSQQNISIFHLDIIWTQFEYLNIKKFQYNK